MKKDRNRNFNINESKALNKIVLDAFEAIEKTGQRDHLHYESRWGEDEFSDDPLEKSEAYNLYEDDEWEEDGTFHDRIKQEKNVKNRQVHQIEEDHAETEFLQQDLETVSDNAKVIKIKQKTRPPVTDRSRWQEPKGTPRPELAASNTSNEEDLFDADEEKFIANVVKWLAPRENKDVIISRIWNLLTEAAPDSFYAPEAAEAGAAELDKTEPGEPESEKITKQASDQSELKVDPPEQEEKNPETDPDPPGSND